jgi:uncharacterized membrane protein
MASQRQARTGGATTGLKTTTIKTGSPAARSKGGKAAAAKAQAKAARDARSRTEAAGGQPAAKPTSGWRRMLQQKVPEDLPAPGRWLQWTTWLLSVAGLGVSIYLTIVELAPAALICSSTGIVNCANVLHSAEGHIVGIPVAYFGLAFYIYLVLLNSPWAWQRKELFIQRLRLASIIVGICFVLYLVYAELIEIGNICIWCTSVHVVTFALFVLIVFDAVFRRPPIAAATQSR